MRKREIARISRLITKVRLVATEVLTRPRPSWSPDQCREYWRVAREGLAIANQLEAFILAETSKTTSKRKASCPTS